MKDIIFEIIKRMCLICGFIVCTSMVLNQPSFNILSLLSCIGMVGILGNIADFISAIGEE